MAFATIDLTKGITGVLPSANATYSTPRKNAKPLMINGNMAVAQRGTSFTSNGYTVDRFTFDESTDGAVTVTQDSTVPSGQGFGKSVKFDVTTADSSIGADQYCQWTQFIEGQNLQLLKYGTSSAENLTLAFWVRSNKTGTYGVRFVKEAGGQTRYECPIEYSISSADTWEKKIINLSPTAGSTTFITNSAGAIVNSNASGYRIAWILTSGSNKHGTNNTWTTTSDRMGTTNQVNFLDNTSNELYITGVQLEVGEYTSSTLPPFQHESFGDNLARCQRYFQMIAEGNQKIISMAHWGSSTEVDFVVEVPTTMRARPTLDYTTGNEYWAIGGSGGSTNTLDNLNVNSWSTDSNINLWSTTGAGGTAGFAYYGYTNNASAKLGFTSEL